MVNLRHSCPITQSEGAKTFVTGVYVHNCTIRYFALVVAFFFGSSYGTMTWCVVKINCCQSSSLNPLKEGQHGHHGPAAPVYGIVSKKGGGWGRKEGRKERLHDN